MTTGNRPLPAEVRLAKVPLATVKLRPLALVYELTTHPVRPEDVRTSIHPPLLAMTWALCPAASEPTTVPEREADAWTLRLTREEMVGPRSVPDTLAGE